MNFRGDNLSDTADTGGIAPIARGGDRKFENYKTIESDPIDVINVINVIGVIDIMC